MCVCARLCGKRKQINPDEGVWGICCNILQFFYMFENFQNNLGEKSNKTCKPSGTE